MFQCSLQILLHLPFKHGCFYKSKQTNTGASTGFNSQSALVFFLTKLLTSRVSLVSLNQIFISSMGFCLQLQTHSILHWTIPLGCPISTSNSTYPKQNSFSSYSNICFPPNMPTFPISDTHFIQTLLFPQIRSSSLSQRLAPTSLQLLKSEN